MNVFNSGTSSRTKSWKYDAPDNFNGSHSTSLQLSQIARPVLFRSSTATSTTSSASPIECSICLEDLKTLEDYQAATTSTSSSSSSNEVEDYHPCFQLRKCQHVFHYDCLLSLQSSSTSSSACPICRTAWTDVPQGTSPSGTMSVQPLFQPCPGFPDAKNTLVIQYRLPDGVQKSYHEHPGVGYSGDTRVAYLPDTPQGRALLARLVYAFQCGLTFRVGTSLTTGRSNQVVWASIHHKTSLTDQGGRNPFGFPDPTYIQRCHAELNQLGVPECPSKEYWYE